MPTVRSNVAAAKRRLAEGNEELKRRHRDGCPGGELCALTTDLRDEILRGLFQAAWEDLAGAAAVECPLLSQLALVAHGGYGRRELAPYSDLDLMVLHAPAAHGGVVPLAERLLRDGFDAGLLLGHSVRTPEQAIVLACKDPLIATSLIESRLLAGSDELFSHFVRTFRYRALRQSPRLMSAIVQARLDERARYGETVYLLEPNIKRSRGALRELHLLRWIGFSRYGTPEPRQLRSIKALSEEDLELLERGGEFLLRVRNEMHFHAAKPADILDRTEQVRIARQFGYPSGGGLTPAERFMQEYFQHTNRISHIATRFVASARSRDRLRRLVTTVFGHRVEQDLRAGPGGLLATPRGLEQLRGDLTAIIRMADLASLYDKPIAPETWEAVRREVSGLPQDPSPEACHHFLSLLSRPARLGDLLVDLRDAGVLQRFIPTLTHAQGLLQLNQYHKYTVDEHCLRAVGWATRLFLDMGPLGNAYRRIGPKHLLHLALLIHDLGKGFGKDHSEVARSIARQTADRLGLAARDAKILRFLVHKHLLMNHLAFRRDTGDERLVLRFARQLGSPEMLHMLFVLTAADLAAVGPGVWDGWKARVLTDFYHRTVQYLAGDTPATTIDKQLRHRRQLVRSELGPQKDHAWFLRQLDALPSSYLNTSEPRHIAADLRLLHGLESGKTIAQGYYLPETDTVRFTVATHEETTPGVFHKLTGALSSQGLEIRSAEINTLADGLVLDRFWVHDPDYRGEPPPERIAQVNSALVQSLDTPGGAPLRFPRRWRVGGRAVPEKGSGLICRNGPKGASHKSDLPPFFAPASEYPAAKTRVSADNSTSDRCTILDVFTQDRRGLLYAITRTLFELGLSVSRAKIGTYGEQVVDVFYVTDQQGRKIEDHLRLEEISRRLLAEIEPLERQ
jgi:[protein-PII] uridylyltransferase